METQFKPFAVTIFVESPEGIPLVKDPSKPDPKWKFAGGKGEAYDASLEEAAAREFEEEVGPIIPLKLLEEVYEVERMNPTPHMYHFSELPFLPCED